MVDGAQTGSTDDEGASRSNDGEEGPAAVTKLTIVEKFFIGPYSTACHYSLGGTIVVLAIGIFTAVCACTSLFIKPQKTVPILAPPWHNYAKLKTLEGDIKPCPWWQTRPVPLTIVWGAVPENNAPR